MNMFKKAAAAIAAAAMAMSAMAVSSFAAGDTYKLYVQAGKGSVGDTVSVSVLLDSFESAENAGIKAIDFTLNYDPTELELQGTVEAGSAFSSPWLGNINSTDTTNGKINFGYLTVTNPGLTAKGIGVMSASFKVLKSGATLTLTDVNVTSTNSDDDAVDLTASITTASATVECSHKKTEVTTALTDCEAGGTKTTVCKDCSTTVKTETIAAAAHKVTSYTVTTPATCTAKGAEQGTCTVCGKTVTRETDMASHTFGSWTVTTPATCTEKGEESGECSVCGNTVTREIDMKSHTYGDWTVTAPATCTEAGTKKHTCSVCSTDETEAIPALGHDWGEWETVEEAANESEGSEKRICKVCSEEDTRAISNTNSGTIIIGAPVVGTPVIGVSVANTDSTASQAAEPQKPNAENKNSGAAALSPNLNAGSNDKNQTTGAAVAILPAAISMAAILIGKKRK
ncbi:MAG: cohesin domain-containing protein [[Eubacterium] siraeum]|nr:cohesin domain-containing protein [[Eubacterium] siraeum]